MSNTSTPMGRLTNNLRMLKTQLNDNFNIRELQTRESNYYKNIEKKEIKSDYMLLFVNKYNIAINFAFVFWYKEVTEDSWLIDITTKNTDGNIVLIKQFSFNKFKEVLNNLVKLNIDINSIFDYIMLLKNVKDGYIVDIEKRNETILSECQQNISDKVELKNELDSLSNKISDKIQMYFDTIEESEVYKENCRLRKELEDSNNKLLLFRKETFNNLEIRQIATIFYKKEGEYNLSITSLYDKFSKSFKNKIPIIQVFQGSKFVIPKFRLSAYQLKYGITNYE